MAVKTKDLSVNYVEFTSAGKEFDAKGKTALKIDEWHGGLGNLGEMCIEGDKLIVKLDSNQKIMIKNYKSLKYLKNADGNLFDFIEEGTVANKNEITFNSKKLSATGTVYSDTIAASLFGYTPKGTSKKGLTIDGGKGNDSISGTDYNDVIKGGDGDDTIYGGEGNDTITGGKGENTISYRLGDGNDIINLTKGEKFTLDLIDVESEDNIAWGYANKNKDVVIYTAAADEEDKSEFITLKNFGSKDVLNNATKKSEDTSSAEICLHPENSDMEAESYKIDIKDLVFTSYAEKNFTGTWLKDKIDAGSYHIYKDKAKTQIDENYNKKGLRLDGKGNNDTISGSNYSDTIYGGDGDDKIYGGKGNDTIYGDKGSDVIYGDEGNDVIYGGNDTLGINFIYGGKGNDTITGGKGNTMIIYNDGDGKDVINITKGENLRINAYIENIANPTFKYSENKKDLIISFGSDEETITLKNFVARKDAKAAVLMQGSTVYKLLENNTDESPYITTQNIDKNFTGTWMKDNINAYDTILYKDKKKTIEKAETDKGLTLDGGAGDDTIFGTKYSDIIKGGDGDDLIKGGKGNDTLTGGKGHNTYYYEAGEGYDVINITKGEELEVSLTDTSNYDLKYGNGNKDLIISRSGDVNGSITLKNFAAKDITQSATLTRQDEKQVDLKEATVKTAGIEKSFTGSWMNDSISAIFATKNITLRGGDGNDTIIGGSGNDKIYGDNGNDTIHGKKGNDTITGGNGENHIMYSKGDGNDVINLTKGEDFYLHFDSVADVNNAEWEFKGNDLRIWAYGKEASDQFVTIKNAKKMINNTNTAKIIINDNKQLDLKTIDYNVSNLMSQVTAWYSSTGTSGYSLTASTDPTADMGTLASAFTPENFNMV